MGPRYGPPNPPALVAPRQSRGAPRSLLRWGAPTWPPKPPSARRAPAKPWRASITVAGDGGLGWPPMFSARVNDQPDVEGDEGGDGEGRDDDVADEERGLTCEGARTAAPQQA